MMIALFVIVEMVMVVVVGVEFSWVFFTSIACFIAPVVFICLEVNLVFPEDPVKENSGWVIGGAQCRIPLSQMCRILNLPHSGVRNGYVPTPRKEISGNDPESPTLDSERCFIDLRKEFWSLV